MKRITIVIVLFLSIVSCSDRLKIDKHKITLDGNEQEVVIKANKAIHFITIDCDEQVEYNSTQNTKTAAGSWFEVMFGAAAVREAKITVSKNETGSKRKIKVNISDTEYESSCTITQKPL